jgi:hypothetical protein
MHFFGDVALQDAFPGRNNRQQINAHWLVAIMVAGVAGRA